MLLALIPGLLGILLYYRGLSSTRASHATLAELAFPATAVALNWALLGVGVNAGQVVGFILLWVAIYALGRLAGRTVRDAPDRTPQTGERMTDTQASSMDHTLGLADAPVTLVEYGDYQCPYCAKTRPVLEDLIEKTDGKARLVFRHYPLDSVHPLARRAAEAAEAAGAQGRFWPMHGLLYENQEDLTDEDLRSYAAYLELDLARFGEDLAENRHAGRVQENRLAGERKGVRGTPGVFLNGVPYEGRLEVEPLLEAVEEAAGGADAGSDAPVRRVGPENLFDRYEDPIAEICSEERGVNNSTLKRVVELAVEIAREGREGRKIGTLFAVGDHEAVLVRSRPLILDPLAGHPDDAKHVKDPDMRETVKELAQLDGAFVVANEGVVVSAARYLDAASENLDLPLGLGSRHMAAASISLNTNTVAVAVSESSTVRVFDEGKVVAEVVPEVWMLRGYGPYPGPRSTP